MTIGELEREIQWCDEALDDLETEEGFIKALYQEIKDGAENPMKIYDMTAAGEFRGYLENEAEQTHHQAYTDVHTAQADTLKHLEEIAQAKERIREYRRHCKDELEELKAQLNNNAEQKDGEDN